MAKKGKSTGGKRPDTSRKPSRKEIIDAVQTRHEKLHFAHLTHVQGRIRRSYLRAINEIVKKAASVKIRNNKNFRLSDYPELSKAVNRIIKKLFSQIEIHIVSGIDDAWQMSDDKNLAVIEAAYGKTSLIQPIRDALLTRNVTAQAKFAQRAVKGLKLSDRVWKYSNQFQNEIEQALYVGITEGTPAKRMASHMKQYLVNPDKLFRRVRDAEGKLVLSKAAKEYHPGQGVYRSSYKNALRLSATEVNMAYRSADMERYSSTQFILGYEVKLSAAHPQFDICDHLKGKYPKTFVFTGWHPRCLCFTVSILAPRAEFDKYQDAVLNGTDKDFKFSGTIREFPDELNKWIADNTERIKGWKSVPYFLTDNKLI